VRIGQKSILQISSFTNAVFDTIMQNDGTIVNIRLATLKKLRTKFQDAHLP
jgi:hypothetical protein